MKYLAFVIVWLLRIVFALIVLSGIVFTSCVFYSSWSIVAPIIYTAVILLVSIAASVLLIFLYAWADDKLNERNGKDKP